MSAEMEVFGFKLPRPSFSEGTAALLMLSLETLSVALLKPDSSSVYLCKPFIIPSNHGAYFFHAQFFEDAEAFGLAIPFTSQPAEPLADWMPPPTQAFYSIQDFHAMDTFFAGLQEFVVGYVSSGFRMSAEEGCSRAARLLTTSFASITLLEEEVFFCLQAVANEKDEPTEAWWPLTSLSELRQKFGWIAA